MPTMEMLRQRLHNLGWKTDDDGQRADDGSWWLVATSCGHIIVALADTQNEVWSAACRLAMRLTREDYGRLEFFR